VATTILASLGVALSLASLVWQALSFRLSGSRVSAEVRTGMKNATAASTIAGTASETHLAILRAQGFDEPTLAVRVINAGRAPTSVVKLDITFGKGAATSNTVFDPPLPFRLEGESEQTWHFDARLAEAYRETLVKTLPEGTWHLVRGRVWVGGREKPIVSKNQALIP
jgi:hypothetical protein